MKKKIVFIFIIGFLTLIINNILNAAVLITAPINWTDKTDYTDIISTSTMYSADGKIAVYHQAPTKEQLDNHNGEIIAVQIINNEGKIRNDSNYNQGRCYGSIIPNEAVVKQKQALIKDYIDKLITMPTEIIK